MNSKCSGVCSIALGIVLALLLQGTALAQETPGAFDFAVNKTADTADGLCDADCSLREAIIAANAKPGNNVILLPAGVYELTLVGNGEDAAQTGDLDITDDLVLLGAGAEVTVIDAYADNEANPARDRGFQILNVATVEIANVTVRDGLAVVGSAIDSAGNLTLLQCSINNNGRTVNYGAAIHNTGTLMLRSSTVAENGNPYISGGGIFNEGGAVTLEYSTLRNNMAGAGGGIHNSSGSITIKNSTIEQNGSRFPGGGIYSEGASIVTIVDSTLSKNGGRPGGGIFVQGGRLMLNNSVVQENSSQSSGGGLYIANGTVTVENQTVFRMNFAVYAGGGIYNNGSDLLSLANVQIEANRTQFNDGGGIYNQGPGGISIRGLTVISNTAAGSGGGIYNLGELSVDGMSIANNRASDKGGGLFHANADARISHTGFSGNQARSDGGGVYSLNAKMFVNESSVAQNQAARGAGIFNQGDLAALSLNKSVLNDNVASVDGGAIASYGGANGTASVYLMVTQVFDNVSRQSSGGLSNSGGTMTLNSTRVYSNVAEGGVGGGISNGATLVISNSSVNHNQAWQGAGIYNGGSVTVAGTEILGNQASQEGGGIYNSKGMVTLGGGTLVSQNRATSGGGLFNFDRGQVTIEGAGFGANLAGYGAAIHNSSKTGVVSATGGWFENNRATGDGGAIYNQGSFTARQVRFTSNRAIGGGAILNWAEGKVALTECTLNENQADNGGAIETGENGNVVIESSLLRLNHANYAGGALWSNHSAKIELRRTTVSENSALYPGQPDFESKGGAIYLSGISFVYLLDGSVVSNNEAVYGGGVAGYSEMSLIVVDKSEILSNIARKDGGGIYNRSMLHIQNHVLIRGNQAAGVGGGIWTNTGGTTIDKSIISENIAKGGKGGGVYNASPQISFSNCAVQNNVADHFDKANGGGVYNESGLLKFTNCIVSENRAKSGNQGYGGALYNLAGTIEFVSDTLRNNIVLGWSNYAGSAIYNETGTLTVRDSSVITNSADGHALGKGGAIHNQAGTVEIINSTISGNTANPGGSGVGGIFNTGVLHLTNSTIVSNSSYLSGGIAGSATLKNTILAYNRAVPTDSGNCHANATITSLGYNLDSDGSCRLTGPGDASKIDPLLGPLAHNGGPTLTHKPQVGSPAIDTGTNDGCPATDQRGQPRSTDGNGDGKATCDKGSVETEAVPVLKATITMLKDAQPNSVQDFTFYGAYGKFKLDDAVPDDVDGVPNSITYDAVLPGIHNFTEATFPSWYLAAIECTPKEKASVDLPNRRLTLSVLPGDNITCTWVNQRRITLQASKFNDLNGDSLFTPAEPYLPGWEMVLYTGQNLRLLGKVTDDNGSVVFNNRIPGTYTVCETPKAGWTNTLPGQIDPMIGIPCYNFTLQPGQNASVLFGNTQGAVVRPLEEIDPNSGVTVGDLSDINEPESEEESEEESVVNPKVFLPMISR